MSGCVLKTERKALTMAGMLDGQLAVTNDGNIVQCFDSTKYGANSKHWVVLGRTSGASFSCKPGATAPSHAVRLLEKGESIVVQ
jgi:hypothetical protein